jgi:hypothetical protein
MDAKVTPVVAGAIIVGIAIVAYLVFRSKEGFTRTCLTADTNCRFTRLPVDYAFEDITDIPEKMGMPYPHFIANPTDKLQPLSHGRIDLIKDEKLLWHPNKLWKQYEHNWKGCGDNKPYIVNDEKTRFSLADTGDIGIHRMLDGLISPRHGPTFGNPALTEQDIIQPEPFYPMYGGYATDSDLDRRPPYTGDSYLPMDVGNR